MTRSDICHLATIYNQLFYDHSISSTLLPEKKEYRLDIDTQAFIQTNESSIIKSEEDQFEIIQKLYNLVNYHSIKDFLSKHKYLLIILTSAFSYLKSIFELNEKPYLELCVDPEENYEGLFIKIPSKEEPEKLISLLEDFDLAWLKDFGGKYRDIFCVDVSIG